ncbi:hypothetical protein LYSHEL_13300 [Lysobacter helvus]|uniref:Uncharacterized protein n=2 Tax=Lysobacteraceae TaxID=32033 RepID=A0ABM7Q4R6_9GAMM|nr:MULTISPECIES: hypothetical protein [Lysobacter]BCT92306.1 hypothetical protein LYSCAS_13300 [Lysobacter caseinilyticus]BCT95459.1 hypothetical protein LYSHEL_13300 [Lysobacter helvus]
MHNKHSHRIVEKTAENRFLQHQPVDADEARSHHVAEDEAPPVPAAAELTDADRKDANA